MHTLLLKLYSLRSKEMAMRKWILFSIGMLAAKSMAHAQGGTCESLRALKLEAMTVTSAEPVAAGAQPHYPSLPAFCRVAATMRPTKDSEIHVEVWLPERNAWNGKYLGTGNGGWGGAIEPGEMAAGVERGYAASSTDTGHSGASASFAMGHPEKLIDFGYRSVHGMTEASKALIAAYYGGAAKLAYFQGCSSGGRQALMEAQRYPADYDGIVAGSATNNWNAMMFGRMWVAQATLSDKASYIPPAKYPMIHRAALAACDAMDGVTDGVIGNPMECRFDPGVLACKADSDGADCLTKPQVEAARRIYTPATNPRTGVVIFPPMERGSELVWGRLAGGPEPIQLADDYFKYVVFENPLWDFKALNFDGDYTKGRQRDGGVLSATNPDLRPFFAHGGKLITYHGWTDQQVMPENSINYYKSVAAVVGAKTDDSYRLFMAPGMNHCSGGDGPNKFDMLGALEVWRETGRAPDAVLASHATAGKVDRTRPLCAYPAVAKYKGSGSTDEAANFSCVKP
jgi:feruloyl esterase